MGCWTKVKLKKKKNQGDQVVAIFIQPKIEAGLSQKSNDIILFGIPFFKNKRIIFFL